VARKRTTSHDVAKLAGVSRTTVSFVLNDVRSAQISDETRRRVLEAAKSLGYHPDASARSLATRQTRTIAIVLYQTPDRIVGDAFLANVVRGLSEVARQRGFRLLLHPFERNDEDEYLSLVLENRIDGLLLSGPRSDDEQLLRLHQEGFPIVLMGQLHNTDIPFVDVDNASAAELAVDHLIGLGHKRIALITNAPPSYTASADRHDGYRRALLKAGLEYDESLVRHGNFRAYSGYQAMEDLLSLTIPVTATFVASDEVAAGALAALHQHKTRVPEDMAIVGFDDIPLASYLNPPLTTVRLPAYELGLQSARMLIDRIESKEMSQSFRLLETALVVRESCGARRP